MSIRWLLLPLALLATALLVAGCAVDPIEKLQDQLDSRQLADRKTAVKTLETMKDDRSVELLIETLESDPDLLEQAGNALVIKGRGWEQGHPKAKKSEQNPVIEHLSQTVGDMHLDAAIRAKACWILGEVGSRRALPALKARVEDPNSMIVRTETGIALNKLGSSGDAAALEMLADGTLVKSYDPEKRGMVIKEEEAKATERTEQGGAGKATETKKAAPSGKPETKQPTKPATQKA